MTKVVWHAGGLGTAAFRFPLPLPSLQHPAPSAASALAAWSAAFSLVQSWSLAAELPADTLGGGMQRSVHG